MTRNETLSLRMRLAIIGPVFPLRGGIAQHTTMLHRAAGPMTNLLTISFTRMYPAWLFPGQSEADPSFKGQKEPGVEYIVDSLNPLTWHRAVNRVLKHRPEIVVIPWWTIYWTFCFWYLSSRFRRAGIKVIFLCHNVVDHESAFWKIFLSKQVLKQADSFLVQSKEDREKLQKLLPRAEIIYQPHPLYNQFPKPADIQERRAGLEILFFGFVRPYKGLDMLIEALGLMPSEDDFFLTVAGEFWRGKNEIVQKISQKSLQEKTEIIDRYIPENEVADLFQRADIVVLPYQSATGSGIISLAYHYNKPVIVTRVGGLPDVVEEGKTGLIVSPGSPDELAAALAEITQQQLDAMSANISEYKKQFTWERLVEAVLRMSTKTTED